MLDEKLRKAQSGRCAHNTCAQLRGLMGLLVELWGLVVGTQYAHWPSTNGMSGVEEDQSEVVVLKLHLELDCDAMNVACTVPYSRAQQSIAFLFAPAGYSGFRVVDAVGG